MQVDSVRLDCGCVLTLTTTLKSRMVGHPARMHFDAGLVKCPTCRAAADMLATLRNLSAMIGSREHMFEELGEVVDAAIARATEPVDPLKGVKQVEKLGDGA